MCNKAKVAAKEAGVENRMHWSNEPYQSLTLRHSKAFDLILCHAVIEWLANPRLLLPALASMLRDEGNLSLCFYNPTGRVYRNLIFGNFRMLNQEGPYKTDAHSLTPSNPSTLESVRQWLESSKFKIRHESGIRVFSDYVTLERGGHQSPEEVIQMELKYSDQEPYKWLGRYLHISAQLDNNG